MVQQKKQTKRQRDIKTKLMAAICMLLVSSIMMVSTTYAWFTLSTAPEVKGITTAVGANGNLEMALQPFSGASEDIESNVGDSSTTQAVNLANITWGNLVDLSSTEWYGLDKIMLYPSALNATGDDTSGYTIGENPLSTPEYGADGRVTTLATKTITGVFQNDAFNESATDLTTNTTYENAKGVRAVGVASGMTERQLAYRAALSSANTAAGQAKRMASTSLNNNGATLANIAIKHATGGGNDTYNNTEVAAMKAIVQDLVGYGEGEAHVTGSLEYIETALKQYIIAYSIANISDDLYEAVVTDVMAAELATVSAVANVKLPGDMANYITKLTEAQSKANTALTTLNTLSGDNIAWADISGAMNQLANINAMQINGTLASDAMDDPGALAGQVLKDGGVILTMLSGAGVYADIADFCGDYSASITVAEVAYGDIKMEDVPADMTTKTNQNPVYLDAAAAVVNEAGFTASAGGSSSNPISDFYGYIIDLAFRTNAAGSRLQLQTEAVDRIYSDGSNTATMGGGASMTFTSTSASFSGTGVKSLMSAIRVVFFETDTREVIGYARLNPASAETSTTGAITMGLGMTDKDGNFLDSAAIMELSQNTVHELSVLVYLDGENITNADVAYENASSMTGKMNLQFSSSATLVPMEYTDLRTGTGEEAETPSTPTVTTLTGVSKTAATGTTISDVMVSGNIAGFTVTGYNADTHTVTATVGGNPVTLTASEQNGVPYFAWTVAGELTDGSTVAITVAEK